MKYFLSIGAASFWLLVFAIACAVATIIETVYSTEIAWAMVYNTLWFGAIMVLLGINLAYNIIKYNLIKIKKLPAFLFHFSFLFILLGAILTRYFGFEGNIHIRENESSNLVSTRDFYIQLVAHDEKGEFVSASEKNYLSLTGKTNFDISLPYKGKSANLKYTKSVANGGMNWVEGENGEPRVEFLFSNSQHKRNISLKQGENIEIGDFDFAFNTMPKQPKFIYIKLKDGKFYLNTNLEITQTKMADMSKSVLEKNTDIELSELGLYSFEDLNFAPVSLLKSAVKGFTELPKDTRGEEAILANLSYNGEEKEVYLIYGRSGESFSVGGENFVVAWAPKSVTLPFEMKLKDFKLDRYPGSNSPSGYSSEVSVIDGEKSFDYEIYMNHVLDWEGYRFFQSSYDTDEKGTILSVNRDPGKMPTYIGYGLLILGMLFNFFNPNSRFIKLSNLINESTKRENSMPNSQNSKTQNSKNENLPNSNSNSENSQNENPQPKKKNKKSKKSKGVVTALFLAFLIGIFTPNSLKADNLPQIDKSHINELKTLVIQGFDGRMEPFDTVSRELLSKIYRKENFQGLNHNAVMLSFMANPEFWKSAEIIKVSEKELKKILGIAENKTHAKMADFFETGEDGTPHYKLTKMVEEINRKPLGNRGVLDKEILKVDERVNIFYMSFVGEFFRVIPKLNSQNNEWFSYVGANMYFSGDEKEKALGILNKYFDSVVNAQKTGDWESANSALRELKEYQLTHAKEIMPTDTAIKFEVFFNNFKIFTRLIPVYILAGLFLLAFVFVRMMSPKTQISGAFKAVYIVNFIAFVLHTIGLIIRWYISGHAPWSNSYESMVYIAWALSLSGMIFSKKSAISLALTSIMAGITLFVAFLSGMDPQITNIQPVLKSYWLTIHVSVITASYGFLGLCWLLGIFTLILFIFQNPKKNAEFSRNIKEATHINEMSMILGLCLLTVGNFLGGVWANESWGRYWGWDPKETWALVTILVYAAVVHFRFIPKLNDQYAFAVASVFAFSSVVMTYFGVNYYLSGMHSYAAGERVPVPAVVWVLGLVLILLAFFAYFKKDNSQKL